MLAKSGLFGEPRALTNMVATILLRRLNELLDTATDSTQLAADPSTTAEVKRLARTSDSTLQCIFELLMTRLKQNHSQVR